MFGPRRIPIAALGLAFAGLAAIDVAWDTGRLPGVESIAANGDPSVVVWALLAIASCIFAAGRSSGHRRAGWLLLGGGLTAWGLGQVPAADTALPFAHHAGLIARVAMLLPGIALLGRINGKMRLLVMLDVLALTTAVAAAEWHNLTNDGLGPGELLLPGLEVVGSLAVLAALAYVLRVAWSSRAGTVVGFVGLGLFVVLLSDFTKSANDPADIRVPETFAHLGWWVGLSMVALGAVLQARWRTTSLLDYSPQSAGIAARVWQLLLPASLVPALFGLVVSVGPTGRSNDVTFVAMTGAAVAFVLLRQSYTIWNDTALNRRLREVRDGLESRVEERTREALGAAQRFKSLTESAPDGILTCDAHAMVLSLNPAGCRMLGIAAGDLIGRHVLEIVAPGSLAAVEQVMSRAAANPGAVVDLPVEAHVVRSDGEELPAEASLLSWEDGGERYFGAIFRDVTDRKRHEAELKRLAEIDDLTDLFNQRRFEFELEMALKKPRLIGALLFIDIDFFKGVNDSFGHRVGDELLASVAALLRRELPANAIIGRRSGDEFSVLLPRVEGPAAHAVAERLVEAIRGHSLEAHGQRIGVTASIGVALFPLHAQDSVTLLVRADQAMYRAKERRDRASVFDWGENDEAGLPLRRPWEQRIRDALEVDGFVFEFQPISDFDGHVLQWEALIRLVDENGELIAPGNFIEAAERSGLIHDIDRWVVGNAVDVIARRRNMGEEVTLEVNLGAAALNDRALLPFIRAELDRSAIDPRQLIFEITETAAIADLDAAREFIIDLKRLGCRFALDDFGAGFSSLSALRRLPVDYLKIDGSFIRNLAEDPINQALVRSIVQMARALKKQTIAEFVTSAETLAILRGLGVNLVQGYYVGMPRVWPEDVAAEPLMVSTAGLKRRTRAA